MCRASHTAFFRWPGLRLCVGSTGLVAHCWPGKAAVSWTVLCKTTGQATTPWELPFIDWLTGMRLCGRRLNNRTWGCMRANFSGLGCGQYATLATLHEPLRHSQTVPAGSCEQPVLTRGTFWTSSHCWFPGPASALVGSSSLPTHHVNTAQ